MIKLRHEQRIGAIALACASPAVVVAIALLALGDFPAKVTWTLIPINNLATTPSAGTPLSGWIFANGLAVSKGLT